MEVELPEKVVIGNAELWLGDCREILPAMPKVDLILTDPPYGIGFAAQPTTGQRRAGRNPEQWDNVKPPSWLFGLMQEQAQILIIWGGNYYTLPPSRGWLTWRKPDAPPSMAHIELAWTSLDMNAKQIECSIAATNAERVGHPTQKPLKVMEWCLGFTPKVFSVCDPFMGSGTTGVAAINLGRKFIGIEREPKYFEIACKRIEHATEQAKQRLFDPEPEPQPETPGLGLDDAV